MKERLLSSSLRRSPILLTGFLGAIGAVAAVAMAPPAHLPEPHPAEEPPAASSSPLPSPVPEPARRVDAEATALLGSVTPKGALVLVIDGEAALSTLERAAAASVPPGDTSLAPLRTAADRLGGALSGMDVALRHGDAGFFPALRDGCRALVELRTVARWLSVPPPLSEPIGQLTDLLRDLRFRYGAEAMRARLNTPLQPAERSELRRLATTARRMQAQLAPPRKPAPAKAPAAPTPPPPPPPPPPPSPAAPERLQVARLIQLILVSPSSLSGYLTSLLRTDVVLGTLAGEQSFRGGSEPSLDSAANDLAAASDTSLLFTANLSSGDTWNYLRQDDTAPNAATALLEASPGELDPFEGDGPTAADEMADQPVPPADAPAEPVSDAPTDAAPAPVAPVTPVATADPAQPAVPSSPDAPTVNTEAPVAPETSEAPAGETLAESLAKELGGTFENGTIIIHGNADATGAAPAASDDDDVIPTQDITSQEVGNAWHTAELSAGSAESDTKLSPEDLMEAFRLDAVSLGWLMGGPAFCPLEPPSLRCPATNP